MLKPQSAAFSFESFKVPEFSYNESSQSDAEIKIGFLPSGLYNSKSGEYELTLKLITRSSDETEQVIFKLSAIAKFKFEPTVSLKEIPDYFKRNFIKILVI